MNLSEMGTKGRPAAHHEHLAVEAATTMNKQEWYKFVLIESRLVGISNINNYATALLGGAILLNKLYLSPLLGPLYPNFTYGGYLGVQFQLKVRI